MDEPFGALDEQTRVVLQQELLRIWGATRKTVVFITHSVDEALTLADRVLVMSARPGRIIAEVPIPFERPRDVLELRRDPRQGEITYHIWSLLRAGGGLAPEEVPA
jgi:NitT/TauT family transport system ATP-binding protein